MKSFCFGKGGRSSLDDGSHLLEADPGDLDGVPRPQILPEKFEGEPPPVTDLPQQAEIPPEIQVTIAWPNAILVALLFARRFRRRVIEMCHGHLIRAQFPDGFHRSVAAENVKRI